MTPEVDQDKVIASHLLVNRLIAFRSSLTILFSFKTQLRIALILSIVMGGLLTHFIASPEVFAASPSRTTRTSSSPSATPSSVTKVVKTTVAGSPTVIPTTPSKKKSAAGVTPFIDSTKNHDGLGDQSFFTYVTVPLSDHLTLKVNVGSGNLLVNSANYAMQGTGINFDLNTYYNSISDSDYYNYEYGNNWRANLCSSQYLDESQAGSTGIGFYSETGTGFFFTRNSDGTYTDAKGLNASLTSNGDGTYTLSYHRSGVKVLFGSDTSVAKVTDKNGNSISCTYGTPNGVNKYTLSIKDTQGRVLTMTHNSANEITAMTDPGSRTVTYSYDSNHNLTGITDANQKTTTYGYTSGELTSITDPLTRATSISYVSGTGKVSQLSLADGGNIQFAYHNSGDSVCNGLGTNLPCTVVTDQNGHSTTYAYQANPSWIFNYTKDALGHISSQTLDPENYNVTQQQDALANTNNFSYSTGTNNLTSATDGSNAQTTYGYTDNTHPYYVTSQTDPQKNQTTYSYDTAGNLASAKDNSTQNTLSYTYNSNGTIASQKDADYSSSNPSAHKTTYGYDSKGNLTTVTPPSPLGSTTLTYDQYSRVQTEKDGNGNTTTFTYDNDNRITKVSYQGGASVSYTYDADGNVLTEVDSTGTTTFTYDSRNRELTKTLPGNVLLTNGYDKIGNLTTFIDASGTITYTYDQVNRMTLLTDADGLKTTYTYDNDNRKNSIQYPNGTGQIMTYDGAGRELTDIGGKGTISINGSGQPQFSGTKYINYSYTYTKTSGSTMTSMDLLQQMSELDPIGQVNTLGHSYTYDSKNELKTANRTQSGSSTGLWSYTYDANGNRTGLTYTAGSQHSYSFTYNGANELTQAQATYGSSITNLTYQYDGNGNETSLTAIGPTLPNTASLSRTDVSNAANQVTSGTSSTGNYTYGYSGTDQTDRVNNNGVTETYGTLGMMSEKSASGTTEYVRCSCGLLNSLHTSGQKYYYLFDGEGSIVGVTDSSGNDVDRYNYDPFGTPMGTWQVQVSQPWTYAGGYYNSNTGLYKFGIRSYDSTTGRWTQATPVGGSLQEATKANPYVYADADPVNNVDPSGACITQAKLLAGAAIASIVLGLIVGAAAFLIVSPEALFTIPILGAAVTDQAALGILSLSFGALGGVAAELGTFTPNPNQCIG